MSDVAKWKVHGPAETPRTEFADWDLDQNDWQPVKHFTLTSFRADGVVSTSDTHNPNGSIAHSRWLYEATGRLAEHNSWMNDGPINRTIYHYDEAGRHIRTMQLKHDGTTTELECCSYDADGRKTKVRLLVSGKVDLECGAGNACRASISYHMEGTNTGYSAPGATTMIVTYNEADFPSKILFQDIDHHPLNYVIFTCDSEGRLLSEEMYLGAISPFQRILDRAPSDQQAEMAA